MMPSRLLHICRGLSHLQTGLRISACSPDQRGDEGLEEACELNAIGVLVALMDPILPEGPAAADSGDGHIISYGIKVCHLFRMGANMQRLLDAAHRF